MPDLPRWPSGPPDGAAPLDHCRVPDHPPAAGGVNRDVDQLSPRQREIALAAASALSNKELAAQFNISLGTLKLHLSAIYGRLGLEGRRALMLYVLDRRRAA